MQKSHKGSWAFIALWCALWAVTMAMNPAPGQTSPNGHIVVTSPATVTSAWIDKIILIDATGGAGVTVPAASTVSPGHVTLIKTDNTSNTVAITGNLNGWTHIMLQVENDSVELYNTGEEWFVYGQSQTPNKGPMYSGVHRTVVSSDVPSNAYSMDRDELGGLVRVHTDDSPMMLVLPSIGEIGRAQGYSATTTVCVQWTPGSSTSYYVIVFGNGGDTISGAPSFTLPTRGEDYCFNYDSAGWTLMR